MNCIFSKDSVAFDSLFLASICFELDILLAPCFSILSPSAITFCSINRAIDSSFWLFCILSSIFLAFSAALSDSLFLFSASVASDFDISKAILASLSAFSASAFSLFAWPNASFFCFSSFMLFAFTNISFASFDLFSAELFFLLARENATSASLLNDFCSLSIFWAYSLAVLMISSSVKSVISFFGKLLLLEVALLSLLVLLLDGVPFTSL